MLFSHKSNKISGHVHGFGRFWGKMHRFFQIEQKIAAKIGCKF